MIRATNIMLIAIALIVCSCGRSASEDGAKFLGKWSDVKDPADIMEITRNGNQFLVVLQDGKQKFGATYKDGALEISGVMGSLKLTYVESSGTVIMPGMERPQEYQKLTAELAAKIAKEKADLEERTASSDAWKAEQNEPIPPVTFVDEETGEETTLQTREYPPLPGKSGKPTLVRAIKKSYDGGKTSKIVLLEKYPDSVLAWLHTAQADRMPKTAHNRLLAEKEGRLIRLPAPGSLWIKVSSPEGKELLKSVGVD